MEAAGAACLAWPPCGRQGRSRQRHPFAARQRARCPFGTGKALCYRMPHPAPAQVHGGAGVSDVTPLAHMWAGARTLRLADGPDVVHLETIAKLELAGARRARL